jgi:ribosomal protein S18 acetylase RimI-like enzyme
MTSSGDPASNVSCANVFESCSFGCPALYRSRNPHRRSCYAEKTMQILLATQHDLPALMSLVRRVVPLMRATGNLQWDETYPNDAVFQRDIDLNQLWIAEVNGSIAGVAAITMDQEPDYSQVGWDIHEPAIVVHRLAVDPAFRGQGAAGALMQRAEEVAVERGITALRVDTNTNDEATQRLFPKLGYLLAGEISLEFRPGLCFLCYEKRLSPQLIRALYHQARRRSPRKG